MTRTEQFNEALKGVMFECPLIRLNRFKIVEATEDKLKVHVIVKTKTKEEAHFGIITKISFHKWFEWMEREKVFETFRTGHYAITKENDIQEFYTI